MRKIQVADHLTNDELAARIEAATQAGDAASRRRWQALYALKVFGASTKDVAALVGVAAGTLNQWAFAYRHRGPDAMESKPRGGNTSSLLSFEEEQALLDGLRSQAEKGLVVLAGVVREAAEAKLGRRVSKDYAYDLMHRHGWRKVQPRPHHPKKDKAAQEEEKKTSAPAWRPPRKRFPPMTPAR
jgi:transposase